MKYELLEREIWESKWHSVGSFPTTEEAGRVQEERRLVARDKSLLSEKEFTRWYLWKVRSI